MLSLSWVPHGHCGLEIRTVVISTGESCEIGPTNVLS